MDLIPLSEDHFPLLTKWLNLPHLQSTFGEEKAWSAEMVAAKYSREMSAFIIYVNTQPIGYLQLYDARSYPRDGYDLIEALKGTSVEGQKLAAIDIFIGEPDMLSQGHGSAAVKKALHLLKSYDACLLDPDITNERAIKSYKKAGFIPFKEVNSLLLMIFNINDL